MNVRAYVMNFPDDYRDRIIKVDIPTTKVNFYTVSLEDIVVSKLSSMREKDAEDIENELVYKDLNWTLMDKLIEDVCYGMFSDHSVNLLKINYENYKERFQ